MHLGFTPVKVTLNIKEFWPEDVTIETAAKELEMNPRTVTTIRKGTERGSWETLIKLSRWLTWRVGKTVSVEDLLQIEGEEYKPVGMEKNE